MCTDSYLDQIKDKSQSQSCGKNSDRLSAVLLDQSQKVFSSNYTNFTFMLSANNFCRSKTGLGNHFSHRFFQVE